MRFVLLALMVAAGHATEVFTLADGRTLTGEYLAEKGRLYTTIDGKAEALIVMPEDIVARHPVGWKPPTIVIEPGTVAKADAKAPAGDQVEVTHQAPEAMSPEEKRAALEATAYAAKIREAERAEGAAKKATRDAAGAREDAKDKREESGRHLKKFRARAQAEGSGAWGDEELRTTLVVLPKTSGNNRATVDAWTRAGELDAKAVELDALAKAKAAEAVSLRAEAGRMPGARR